MKNPPSLIICFLLASLCFFVTSTSWGQDRMSPLALGTAMESALDSSQAARIPLVLQDWKGWVLWDVPDWGAPSDYRNYGQRWSIWPGVLQLDLEATGGSFLSEVTVFAAGWVPLPGGERLWPQEVKANGQDIPVLPRANSAGTFPQNQRSGTPSIWLTPGTYRLSGRFIWRQLPQALPLPSTTGILRLTLEGNEISLPAWNPDGQLWLRRDRAVEEATQDFLSQQTFWKMEDGIPLWLEVEMELVVAGKSREEHLGTILPEGWKLASIEAAIPVAVSAAGAMKAQVRAGKWTVRLRAFRTDPVEELRFAEGATPASTSILVGWQARPDFRSVEIEGSPLVDVTQTSYPAAWRSMPVVRWNVNTPLRLVERLRGRGEGQAPPLSVQREWWLDEEGRMLTFQDHITGQRQEIWRLDAAPGQELGSVQSAGVGQLITRNPATGAAGIEVRTRDLQITATGNMPRTSELSASGWLTETQNVQVNLHLPPGWRAVALFGPDWVDGEWVTSWSLLDLFLLLLFTLAVFRMFGFPAALLAFVAFVLFCHEEGAPRLLWLAALVPVALLRVVTMSRIRSCLVVVKWGVGLLLLFWLLPFFSAQIQQALFPQLEIAESSSPMPPAPMAAEASTADAFLMEQAASDEESATARKGYAPKWSSAPAPRNAEGVQNKNLIYESDARIQTGPGLPQWQWRTVRFGWNGPVSAEQKVETVLLSADAQRWLTVLRLGLILALAWMIFRSAKSPVAVPSAPSSVVPPPLPGALMLGLLLGFSLAHSVVHAAEEVEPPANLVTESEMPPSALLSSLRERLLEAPPVFPGAASISSASLQLINGDITLQTTIHAAASVAVPLPIRLQDWSPISVEHNGRTATALRRSDASLWIALEPGVHEVTVRGKLAELSEWQWSFQLPPMKVDVAAPGWTVSGIGENGHPEAQIFFLRQEERTSSEVAYERQDLAPLAVIEREVEVGLLWQIRTTVRRLSPLGRAVSVEVPLWQGEKVLTPSAVIRENRVEVRLGAQQTAFTWQSEMSPTETMALEALHHPGVVERWRLLVSPVWNVTYEGLAPLLREAGAELLPEWMPWPGETVTWRFERPEPLPGRTVTVQSVHHESTVGQRQRTCRLHIVLRASLGEDFSLRLPEGARVTELLHEGQSLPVRWTEGRLVVPLRPGEQTLRVAWQTDAELSGHIAVDAVELSAPAANVTTVIQLPEDRWVLWTAGPLRGPAVRFWVVVAAALVAAFLLGRLPSSPLRTWQWALLGLGLTQVPYAVALVVVGWLFLLVWRGRPSYANLPAWAFRAGQILLPLLTFAVLLVFLGVVAAGLLGSPQMFVAGNGSTPFYLQWYAATSAELLPLPAAWALSDWWYRLFMLGWALWLALMLLRWLQWGWQQYGAGGYWKK